MALAHAQTSIRRPFVVAALIAMLFVVALELGAPRLVGGGTASVTLGDAIDGRTDLPADLGSIGEPPGRGLNYLALVDVALLFLIAQYTLAQMGIDRLQGRLVGIVTFISSLMLLLTSIVLLLIAIVEVMIMTGLFLAFPFGTIAYLGIWGGFPRSTAGAVLTTLVMVEAVGLFMLVLAHASFVRQRGLLIMAGVSLGLKLLLGFLHAVVPRPLVAITDDVGAIISAIVAIIVAIMFLVFSIPSVVKALRVDRLA